MVKKLAWLTLQLQKFLKEKRMLYVIQNVSWKIKVEKMIKLCSVCREPFEFQPRTVEDRNLCNLCKKKFMFTNKGIGVIDES